MSFDVIILPEALHDLDEILAWTKQRAPDSAARLASSFERELATLATRPHTHPRAPESQAVSRDIRQMFFQTRRERRYRALFEVRGQQVLVLHVRGPRQNLVGPDELRGDDLPLEDADD